MSVFEDSFNVKIRSYHADNGWFSDESFVQSVHTANQQIMYCGVGAHHQNGIVEKRIRDITEQARKMLLHAHSKWPLAMHYCLWPYALRTANDLRNSLPAADGFSPMEKFGTVPVMPNLSTYHVFGCPVYALRNELQSKKILRRWEPRARLGLYLGPSPRHAKTVSLVLNL